MKRGQFLAFCVVGFCGCFLGGFLASVGPARALAQSRTIPPNSGQISPNIRNENQLFVPSGGLRMVDERNRVIGMILNQGGGSGLVLMDGSGRPTISLLAGSQGQVVISTAANAVVRMTGPAGRDGVTLTTTDTTSSVKLRDGIEATSAQDGGRLFLSNVKGSHGLRLDTTNDGGRLTGYDPSQRMLFELLAKPSQAQFNLYGKEPQPGFTASGDGSASITRGTEKLWKIPSE